jgi:hypothetical protein
LPVPSGQGASLAQEDWRLQMRLSTLGFLTRKLADLFRPSGEHNMWQPKWYQWLVIWMTFILTGYVTILGEPFTTLTPFLAITGVLIVWMLQARART